MKMNKNYRSVTLPADLVNDLQTRALERGAGKLAISTSAIARYYILLGIEHENNANHNPSKAGWAHCLK